MSHNQTDEANLSRIVEDGKGCGLALTIKDGHSAGLSHGGGDDWITQLMVELVFEMRPMRS